MMSPAQPWTLTARWIIPVDRPPLEHGTVTIDGERIVSIGPHGSQPADVDLGDVAVLPGLVNAHTHLDLTGLRGQCPPTPDFTQWLRGVIRFRRERSEAQVLEDVRAGVAECVRFGTTLVGDIAAAGLSWPVLAESPLWAVVFYEMLGLRLERAREVYKTALSWALQHTPTETCFPGLSPHAPYSWNCQYFSEVALAAFRYGLAAATHVAETRAELELVLERRGPFVPFLEEVGAWDESGVVRGPLEEFGFDQLSFGSDFPRWLLVHGNYLSKDMVFSPGNSVIFCPRTHAAFGHDPHPFPHWLRRGVRVALGTDSLASNPDLNLLEEARFTHRHYPQVPPDQVLRMATLSGAEALGWESDTGSLTPGKSADLVTVPLPPGSGKPHELVLQGTEPARGVLWRGRWLHGPD
jgi:cytosine/adenosine deaminase-related metal-dependent hydrolase